jgi:hypothetical protein
MVQSHVFVLLPPKALGILTLRYPLDQWVDRLPLLFGILLNTLGHESYPFETAFLQPDCHTKSPVHPLLCSFAWPLESAPHVKRLRSPDTALVSNEYIQLVFEPRSPDTCRYMWAWVTMRYLMCYSRSNGRPSQTLLAYQGPTREIARGTGQRRALNCTLISVTASNSRLRRRLVNGVNCGTELPSPPDPATQAPDHQHQRPRYQTHKLNATTFSTPRTTNLRFGLLVAPNACGTALTSSSNI